MGRKTRLKLIHGRFNLGAQGTFSAPSIFSAGPLSWAKLRGRSWAQGIQASNLEASLQTLSTLTEPLRRRKQETLGLKGKWLRIHSNIGSIPLEVQRIAVDSFHAFLADFW